MIQYRVRCIRRGKGFQPWERIAYVGGVNSNGTHWMIAQSQAIAEMEARAGCFVVDAGNGDQDLMVGGSSGHAYLKTAADGEQTDILLLLPECP